MYHRIIVAVLCWPLCFSMMARGQDKDNTLTAAEKKAGWKLLFDGTSLKGWRAYKNVASNSWEVANGANSGVLYHVLETHDQPYETGPEYQLIDDFGYPGKLEDWQKSGADYAMHPPAKLASRPQGEYNHTRIVVKGDHVEHWLNGFKNIKIRKL